MSASLRAHAWPRRRAGEALAALAERAGLAPRAAARDHELPDGVELASWLAQEATEQGVELERVQARRRDARELCRRAGPALFQLGSDEDGELLAVLGARAGRLRVLRPDGRIARVRPRELERALEEPLARSAAQSLDALCDAAGIHGRRRARAREGAARELFAEQGIARVHLVRAASGASTRRALRDAGVVRLALELVLAHAARYALWILSWYVLGQGALEGRIERGWLVAWALLLAAMLPLTLFDLERAGLLCARLGASLRKRVLAGALRLEPEEVRHRGLGQLVGDALEADGIEQAGVAGAYLAATALIELAGAWLVLLFGAREPLPALALAVWTFGALWLVRRALVARRAWTAQRLGVTDGALERMVGHRTLVAQERRERWNAGEDAALAEYNALARSMDRVGVLLEAGVPRGWLVLGLLALLPSYVSAQSNAGALGAGLGSVLLAYLAFRSLAQGAPRAIAARVAWERIAPLWSAAARPVEVGDARFAGAHAPLETGRTSIEAHGLVHRPAGRAQAVLRGVDLCIRAGERVLVCGASGSGKSMLASILAGSRKPDSGLVLQAGLDRATLGEETWRRRAVLAPQFHENHVLMAPLVFNALLGREWPPGEGDSRACSEVLRGLGLGALVERMPGGLAQLVGECGWQLSHGEQSRLFMARALLQDAELVLLDESFAALDPATLRDALRFVESRARTLLVVAHE